MTNKRTAFLYWACLFLSIVFCFGCFTIPTLVLDGYRYELGTAYFGNPQQILYVPYHTNYRYLLVIDCSSIVYVHNQTNQPKSNNTHRWIWKIIHVQPKMK